MPTIRFSGDDIAAAWGMALPSTKCANCPHERSDHDRIVTGTWPNSTETFGQCHRFDRRTRTGDCLCKGWAEPATERTDA